MVPVLLGAKIIQVKRPPAASCGVLKKINMELSGATAGSACILLLGD